MSQLDDEARLLGEAQELCGTDLSALWMPPSNERLRGADPLTLKVVDGLKDQREFITLDGVGEGGIEHEALLDAHKHGRLIYGVSALAERLRVVERQVSVAKQVRCHVRL